MCADWIEDNRERSDESVAFTGLLQATALYVDICLPITCPIQVLAFATRSVFELCLRTQHILLAEENLKRWMAELSVDRIDLLEGFLTITENQSADTEVIRNQIEETRKITQTHGLPLSDRPLMTQKIATAVGQEAEYKAFYKFYSKLVHPSSYSVNYSSDEVEGWAWRAILIVQLLLYADSILDRIQTAANVPDEVTDMAPSQP